VSGQCVCAHTRTPVAAARFKAQLPLSLLLAAVHATKDGARTCTWGV
jgi:hypothetical protein